VCVRERGCVHVKIHMHCVMLFYYVFYIPISVRMVIIASHLMLLLLPDHPYVIYLLIYLFILLPFSVY